jgi:Zn-dependent protease
LIRAVGPPYPGAFTTLRGRRVFIHRTVLDHTAPHRATPLHLHGDCGRCFAVCGDGRTVRLVEAASRDGSPFDLTALARQMALPWYRRPWFQWPRHFQCLVAVMAVMTLGLGVWFISVLFHEFGHALMFRRFVQHPRVILYALGGLAVAGENPYSHQQTAYTREMTVRERIIVSFAGPGAGFLLALVVIVVINLMHGSFWFVFGFPFWKFKLGIGSYEDYAKLYVLVALLLDANIFWGLANLTPVFPLDGGQISRELFEASDPHTGLQKSLWVSVISGGAMAVFGIILLEYFMVLLFGVLAVQSYLLLRQLMGEGGWRHGKGW